MKIPTTIESINPVKARKYLDLMIANRKPKEATIAMYANDMENGKWLLSHQGIAFNDAGELFDGQHRLLAIIRSGVTVEMLVLRGFPKVQPAGRVMDVVDAGAVRSLADRIKLIGTYHGNPNLSAAAAKAIVGIVCGNQRCNRRLSLSATLTIIACWKKELAAVMKVTDTPARKPFRNAHTVAALTLAAAADPVRTDHEMGRLFTGAGLAADSPILALREHILFNNNVDRRTKGPICLSALHAEWFQLPAAEIAKPARIDSAVAWFRSFQESRFAKASALFHSKDEANMNAKGGAK